MSDEIAFREIVKSVNKPSHGWQSNQQFTPRMRQVFLLLPLLARHCKESNALVEQKQLKLNFEKSSFFIEFFSSNEFLLLLIFNSKQVKNKKKEKNNFG